MTASSPVPEPQRARAASGAPLPPPAIVGIVMLAGWGAQRFFPIVFPLAEWALPIGAVFTLAGMLLVVSSVVTLRRARTEVSPWKPSLALVTHGPFALSRNPIYVALLCVQVAFACWFGIGWWIVLVPASWLGLDRLQVRREERYLAATFGDAYSDYLRRVRRWL